MNRVRFGFLDRGDQRWNIQVGLSCRVPGEIHRVVRQLDVKGELISVAVNGDRLNAEILSRPDHAYGDLAAVGDKHPFDLFCMLLRHSEFP